MLQAPTYLIIMLVYFYLTVLPYYEKSSYIYEHLTNFMNVKSFMNVL